MTALNVGLIALAWLGLASFLLTLHGRRRHPAYRLGPACSACHSRTRVRVQVADRAFCGRCLADALEMVEALETAGPSEPGGPPAGGLGAAS